MLFFYITQLLKKGRSSGRQRELYWPAERMPSRLQIGFAGAPSTRHSPLVAQSSFSGAHLRCKLWTGQPSCHSS